MYLRKEIDNFTLARWYLSNAIEENKRRVTEEAKRNVEDNIESAAGIKMHRQQSKPWITATKWLMKKRCQFIQEK